jgi:septal ring factor EnvC (AmiA/AmiB activator)
LLVVAAAAAFADEAAPELEALKRSLAETRARVERYEREERGLLDAIESLDKRAGLLADDEARARKEVRAAEDALAELAPRADAAAAQLAKTRRVLAARAVALYKWGELGPVRVLFGAGSLEGALSEVRVLQLLLERDRELADRYRNDLAAVAAARASAVRIATDGERALQRYSARREELRADRRTRRSLLLRARRDRQRSRGALRELEAAARALEERLSGLRSRRPGETRFEALRGRLPLPVEAPLIGRFGRVRDEFGTEIVRNGLLFGAERGAPVFAVADGEVRFAGWFRGYGRLLIIDHGADHFTVTGHLDRFEVAVADRVRAGELVGRAGDSGSLAGSRVYFEIRRRDEALNPMAWLGPGLTR